MKKVINISEASRAKEGKIINVITDAARAGLMGLSPNGLDELISSQRQITFNTLRNIKELSLSRSGVLTFGPLEWERCAGADAFTAEQKEILELKLWGLDTLDAQCNFHTNEIVRRSHIMVAAPGDTNLAMLQDRFSKKYFPWIDGPRFCKYGDESWYMRELFAKGSTLQFGWHLIPIEMPTWILQAPKTSRQLMETIPDAYQIISSPLEALKNIAVFLLTGRYPNSSRYANTSDVIKLSDDESDYLRVRVGTIPGEGISVDNGRDTDIVDWRVGVAVERKIEMPFPGHMAFDLK